MSADKPKTLSKKSSDNSSLKSWFSFEGLKQKILGATSKSTTEDTDEVPDEIPHKDRVAKNIHGSPVVYKSSFLKPRSSFGQRH